MNTGFIQQNKKKLFLVISLVFLVTLISLAGILGINYVKSAINNPISGSEEAVKFTIEKGEKTSDIAEKLEKGGLIKDKWVFVGYLRYKKQISSLQAGDYLLKKNYSMLDIISILTKGKVTSGKITIPEGWTNKQVEEEAAKEGVGSASDFNAALSKKYEFDFLKESPDGNLQGFLFPNTYFLSSRPTSDELISKMLKEFNVKADPEIRAKLKGTGLSYYQVLTLASIVEREVTSKEDKKKVASVFLNRLENGIKLDSCATVEYVLGTKKRILSSEDISIDSPYNTYKINGLPPTPIANPGLDSIEAVLEPEKTDYLYFFSGKDGKTYFSKNQEEHDALKAKYL